LLNSSLLNIVIHQYLIGPINEKDQIHYNIHLIHAMVKLNILLTFEHLMSITNPILVHFVSTVTQRTYLYMYEIFVHNEYIIVVYSPPLARLLISGANLSDVYYLIQFHFHWDYNAY
jgi:hypothetical protein